MLHDLLLRQLRKLGCDPNEAPSAETWRCVLEDVSRRYEENDRARYLLDRSLEIADREMQELNAGLVAERDRFSHLFRHSPVGMARIDLGGAIAEVNPQFTRILGQPAPALLGRPAASLVLPNRREQVRQMLAELERGERTEVSSEEPLASPTGSTIFTKFTASAVHDERGIRTQLIIVIEDISAWTHHQVELQHTQKLESVGRLAAGIAHEINTPMQFVGTNVTFLESAFSDLLSLCEAYRQACDKAASAALAPADLVEIRAAEEAADLSYLRENVPRALVSSEDGIKRVGKIVHSMKSFAHPSRGARSAADINAALESTLTVANSELRYVADVETDFAQLPPLPCFLNDLNQVFLNLLVNAAHAVGDVVGTSGNKGLVRVKTELAGEHIVVSISDSGTGIPIDIRDRIFDPFFTTKPVGKGTGQGLALARAVVVEKHGGTITFQSELGKGTSFFLHLPLLQESLKASSTEDAA